MHAPCLAGQPRSTAPAFTSSADQGDGVPSAPGSGLDSLELESLMLNLDASRRVHARHHFFSWTQGLLQNLVRHELLICALRNAVPGALQVDAFASPPVEPGLFSTAFRQDTSLVPHLIKTWEDDLFRPVICESGTGSPFAGSALARELMRIGASRVIAHGIYDVSGKPESFFLFAHRPEAIGPSHIYLVELIVPFLHLAWVRSQLNRTGEGAGGNAPRASVLTSREQEVLKWIHLGKSNIEIGVILGISPLTVKNHVQKILRKLDVQNRTQAVGKALTLRILST